MHTLLIVGKSFSSLKRKILENGDDYIHLQDQLMTNFPDKKIKHRVLGDFSSKQSVLRSIQSLRGRVDGVICTYENYILPTAWIADALKLPGLPIKAAEACTDKYLMRTLFAQASEPISPDFAEIGGEKDLLNFASKHHYPLILKPTNLAKSLLITKCHNQRELLDAYSKTLANIDAVYQKYAPHRQHKLLVEEFMEGSVHSVDAFVDSHGQPNILKQIVDYQTGYEVGYDDNFHYSRLLPSRLSAKQQSELLHCADLGVRALGMKNCPAHIEIIMTKEGPRIVEIGARNGGYRERMHQLANGIDILGNALRLALGEQPNIVATRDEPCATLELFPKQSGTFVGLTEEEALQNLSSLFYLSIKAKVGQRIGKSSEGHKAAAVLILHHKNPKQFERDLAFVNQHVIVKTN